MRAEMVILSLLNATSSLVAAAVTRAQLAAGTFGGVNVGGVVQCYGGAAPDNVVAPLVVFALRSDVPDTTQRVGTATVMQAAVDVMAAGRTYGEVKHLQERVRLALLHKAGDVAGVSVVALTLLARGEDQYEPEIREYLQTNTYQVTYLNPPPA